MLGSECESHCVSSALSQLGSNIQHYMDARHITVYQLAVLTAFPVSTIKSWLRGDSRPSNDRLLVLSRVLNVTQTQLILGDADDGI